MSKKHVKVRVYICVIGDITTYWYKAHEENYKEEMFRYWKGRIALSKLIFSG